MKEIGSEFWKPNIEYFHVNETAFLCGRTALDAIIKDAKEEKNIKSVLLPSYCCHTMIEPFVDNEINIRFYDVFSDEDGLLKANPPEPLENEAFYIMTYFGDVHLKGIEGVDRWPCSIEDMTHSCFCQNYQSLADYYFISYRKWFAVDGIAIAGKKNGQLSGGSRTNQKYAALRNDAFELKDRYIKGENIDKGQFLSEFNEAEEYLSGDYKGYTAELNSIIDLQKFISNIDRIRKQRRKNAKVLIDGIKDIQEIVPMVDFSASEECPLFLAVCVKGGKRDALRKFLIERDIYLPVHWPLSEFHNGISKRAQRVYEEELSLVCDQRYNEEDMERMVNTIKEFWKEYKR